MIYILLNVLFNSMLLVILSILGADYFHISYWVAVTAAYVIPAMLTLIGYTRIGTFILSFFISSRKMIGREKNYLYPMLDQVINSVNSNFKTRYKISDFNLRVSDDNSLNAYAFGHNTIIVNRGAINILNAKELTAVIAHEMGHLYYRDSLRSCSLIIGSLGTMVIMRIYVIYAFVLSIIKAIADHIPIAAIPALFGYMFMFIFFPVLILNWLGNKFFSVLGSYLSRKQELRADAFASSLGYKYPLISFLEKIDQIESYDNSIMSKLSASHPTPMQRIGALEDKNTKPSCGFNTNSGLELSNAAIAVKAQYRKYDGIKMLMLLLLAGYLWCGKDIYQAYKVAPNHQLSFFNNHSMVSQIHNTKKHHKSKKKTHHS